MKQCNLQLYDFLNPDPSSQKTRRIKKLQISNFKNTGPGSKSIVRNPHPPLMWQVRWELGDLGEKIADN